MVKTALYRHFAAKPMPTQRFNSMWHAQEHYNSYTQPLINLVSAHLVARVRLCLFYIVFFFFYKLTTAEHSNLHNATLLRLFRSYVGENSRTFQDLILEFKDFSRMFGNRGLFKDLVTIKYKDFSRLCGPCPDLKPRPI